MQCTNECNFAIKYAPAYILAMTIGKKLELAMRNAKILTQKELEERSGIPQATISRILNDRGTKGPETDTLRKLANACGVKFESLLDENDLLLSESTNSLAKPEELAAEAVRIAQLYLDSTPSARVRIMEFAIDADKRPVKSRLYKGYNNSK